MYDWKKAFQYVKNSENFTYWKRLSRYFSKEDVDYLGLIEYYIKHSFPRTPLEYVKINRAAKGGGAKIPPQYMSAALSPLREYSLIDLVRMIKDASETHSVYAYTCAALFIGQRELYKIRLRDYPHVFMHLPPWVQKIMDRQYRLAKNAFKKDDDHFFFTHEFNLIPHVTARKVIDTVRDKLGIQFSDVVYYFHHFAGMPSAGRILYGSNESVAKELDKRRKRSVRSCVSISRLNDDGTRKFVRNGFCIAEPEPGIYLVHTIAGIFIVPFYLLDMPRAIPASFNELVSLRYIEEKDLADFNPAKDLTAYKIKLRKI